MQYKNYNIDLYCSALNEDIGKINVLYNNLESTYGEIINNSDISFNWEGSVKDTFSVKIDNFKSGYNDLYKEKSNLKSISDLMERLKKKLLEYKGIETQLQQSYREKTFVESQLRLTGIDQEGMDKLNQVKNSITNSINTNNNTKNQLSIEIDSLINKLNSIKFSEMYVEKEVESQVASGFETGTRDGTEYGGRGNKIDDQESTSETVVEETRTQSMEALYEIIKYKYKTEMAGGDINTIYNTHEEAVLDYMSQGMTREEAIEFVNNPGYSIRWVVGPEGKGIFTSEEDMMSYLKTDELLGISLKDKTVEQYIEENKHNYQNIPLIAAMEMGVVQSTSTSTPTPTPTVTPTPTPTVTSTPTSTPTPTPTPTVTPTPTPTVTSTPTSTPNQSYQDNKSAYYYDPKEYDRTKSVFIGSKEFNELSDQEKFELDQKYREAIEEGKEIDGIKGGMLAGVKFFMQNNVNIPFKASGESNIYNEGLDTNIVMDKNAPDSVEWLQMIYHDVTGEKNVDFRMRDSSSLSGGFVSKANLSNEINNVSVGDIFFNEPKSSDGMGHIKYVVGKEGDDFLVAELLRGSNSANPEFIGLNVSKLSKEEALKLDGYTIISN